MEGMGESEKEAFGENLQVIMFEDITDIGDIMAAGQSNGVFMAKFYSKVNDKTADQINSLAANIKNKKATTKHESDKVKATREAINKTDAESLKNAELKKKINSMIKVELLSKEYIDGDFQDGVNMEIKFTNGSGKNIKGIKGTAEINDIFDDNITQFNLSLDEPIAAGESFVYEGGVTTNQFDSGDKKLISTPFDRLKFKFKPEVILFEDGTKTTL
tara:strand:- start:115 stop:765 length:651 start_codon:yes stop_codon:yes gene_type:complete